MVAYAQQGGEEGCVRSIKTVKDIQRIPVQVVVLHAEAVHHLLLRIILLRIDFIVTVGAQECVHVVILAFVRHEEEVAVSGLAQCRGQSGISGDVASLHQVTIHQRRVRIKRGIKSVIGMNASRIAARIACALAEQTVKERRERLFLAKGLH